jgi:hypothetical protein
MLKWMTMMTSTSTQLISVESGEALKPQVYRLSDALISAVVESNVNVL